nr:MAG TPA: hypothetical protein [Bacteriophage sp.]
MLCPNKAASSILARLTNFLNKPNVVQFTRCQLDKLGESR